jgi:hypothetical protein
MIFMPRRIRITNTIYLKIELSTLREMPGLDLAPAVSNPLKSATAVNTYVDAFVLGIQLNMEL